MRNRALLVVLYRSGLRVGEALALHPKDVDSRRGTIRVLHGKGAKARTVRLDATALAVVERSATYAASSRRGLTSAGDTASWPGQLVARMPASTPRATVMLRGWWSPPAGR